MEIPDQYVGWIAAAWAAIVTWLVTLERRLLARPTRTEQEAIAARVALDVKGQFDELKHMLEKQDEAATRAELREAIQDSNRIIDQRHAEHLSRLDKQDEELKEIRDGLSHIEGALSGTYKKVQG